MIHPLVREAAHDRIVFGPGGKQRQVLADPEARNGVGIERNSPRLSIGRRV